MTRSGVRAGAGTDARAAVLNTVPPAIVGACEGSSAPRVYLFGSYRAGTSAGVCDGAVREGALPIEGPGALDDAGVRLAAGLAGGVVFAMRMSPELFASRSRRLIHCAKSTGAPAWRT